MTRVITVEGLVPEGSDAHNVGQVTKADGSFLMTTDVTGGWGLDVYERGNTTAIFTLTGQTITQVLTNVPVLDGFWGLDNIGYNFRDEVEQTELATQTAVLEGGKKYLFLYTFPTLTDGTIISRFIWHMEAGPRF